MHEHRLAEEMVASLVKAMRDHGGRRVVRVTVELSEMGGESEPALRHGFEEKSEGTPIEGAELVVRRVAPRFRCVECGHEMPAEGEPEGCPACGSPELTIAPPPALVIRDVEMELPDE